jgi:hypothetical protein
VTTVKHDMYSMYDSVSRNVIFFQKQAFYFWYFRFSRLRIWRLHTAFCDIALCSLVGVHQRLIGAYCFHHQGCYLSTSCLLKQCFDNRLCPHYQLYWPSGVSLSPVACRYLRRPWQPLTWHLQRARDLHIPYGSCC